MSGLSYFQLTVPVLRYYLAQLEGLMSHAEPYLEARLSPDALCLRDHASAAQGYALRIVYPLTGRDVPELDEPETLADLVARGNEADRMLLQFLPEDFDAADQRQITHQAGEADLTQSAEEFLTLYGLPNFIFHIATCHAILRKEGLDIGKPDFDGFHEYPPGFSFVIPNGPLPENTSQPTGE